MDKYLDQFVKAPPMAKPSSTKLASSASGSSGSMAGTAMMCRWLTAWAQETRNNSPLDEEAGVLVME